jgi:hypothetical protein
MVKNNAESRFGRSPSRFCEPGGITVDGVPQAAQRTMVSPWTVRP